MAKVSNILTSAVVALSGITFGIFVREGAAHGGHNRLAYEILRSDQLDVVVLTLHLTCDTRSDLGVNRFDLIIVVHNLPFPSSFSPFSVKDTDCPKHSR